MAGIGRRRHGVNFGTNSTKAAEQPPLSVAMTKLTVNRLAHALDDLAGHMDVDQLRWRVLPRITGRELPPSWNGASRGSEDGRD
jgi:hypothetical protein